MRIAARHLTAALMLVGSTATPAQDLKHGEQLVARWCADCHISGTSRSRARQAMPFEVVAAKPGINSALIADFLMLPHSTMPNLPLRRRDAEDVAAYIMQSKK